MNIPSVVAVTYFIGYVMVAIDLGKYMLVSSKDHPYIRTNPKLAALMITLIVFWFSAWWPIYLFGKPKK